MRLPNFLIQLFTTGLSLFFFLPGITQPDLQFEQLTIEDGLVNNQVRCIFQDSKGFLWFGTSSGLNRYDGHEMKTYLPGHDNPESISLGVIQSIVEDKQGKLWMAGFGIYGINSYDPEKDIFREYLLPETLQSVIPVIYEDRRGNLWAGSWDYGLLRFNKQQERFEPFPVALPEGVDKEMITAILEDSFNQLWFGVSNGLYRFSWQDSSFHFYPLPGGVKGSKDGFINTIFEDSRKNLWIGTQANKKGCFFLFDKGRDDFYRQTFKTNKPDGPPFEYISSINEDAHGRLWLGTALGLYLFDPKTQHLHPHKNPPNETAGPEYDLIWAIFRDRDGDIWVGTHSSGVYHWSSNRKKFHAYQYPYSEKIPPAQNSYIKFFYERADGQIWVAIEDGITLFDPVQERFHREYYPIPAWTLLEDKEGWVWTGTWDMGVGKFHSDTKQTYYYQPDPTRPGNLPGRKAPYIFQDHRENIWANIDGVGLYRYDPIHDSFNAYPLYHSQTKNPIGSVITAMYEDREDNLWIGGQKWIVKINPGRSNFTHYPFENLPVGIVLAINEDSRGALWLGTTEGLTRFDPKSHKAQCWTQKDGLANNYVTGILEDDKGDLWISTAKGLSRFNPKTRQFRNYDTSDGLPSDQFNNNAYLKAKNGEMYFGGISGIIRFHPDSIRDNPNKPLILITTIKINQKEVPVAGTLGDSLRRPSPLKQQAPFAKEIALAYWQKDLSFEFAALNYVHPEKNQYKYRLENYDEGWIATDASRPFANYTNLHPGNYTFRVIGSNNDGLWNEQGASLRITISPPWWFTPWAYSLYAILALTLLYAAYSFQLNRQLAQAETRRLRELDQVKTRLYTNISHEFRTPLTIILGLADQLKTQASEGMKPGLNMIGRNGRRLLHLVNQMLSLRKLESGKMDVRFIQSDIIHYVNYILEAFHSLAENKNIRLHFLSDTETLYMDFDPDKITDILSNLITNAIKYSPDGSDVYLQVHKMADQLQISVKDNGIGIPTAELPRIFDRFYQAPSQPSSSPSFGGTGIGLALTKELVKLLEGEISVKSSSGKGAEFIVLLPIRNRADIQPTINNDPAISNDQYTILAPSSVEALAENGSSGKDDIPLVLIVEDNPDVAHYLASCLQKAYRLIYAADGKAGVDKALEEIPDLIISDVMMPEMDGFELCQILKNDERTSHIPIILLTARADTDSKLQGLRGGADAYLSKPFNEEELKIRLGKLIELRQRLQQRYGGSAFGKDIPLSDEQATPFLLEDAFLQKVKAIIEENLSDAEFGVQQLSQELGLSRSQLFRKLKALTGKSIILYIRSVRLHNAREMLKSTRLNVSEVGYAVGFTNPAHFSTAFLHEFGESPSTLKRS